MENYKNALQLIANENVRNEVFASFSSIRNLDEHSNDGLFQKQVAIMRKNQLFRLCIDAGLTDEQMLQLFEEAITKATNALRQNSLRAFKLAIDNTVRIPE